MRPGRVEPAGRNSMAVSRSSTVKVAVERKAAGSTPRVRIELASQSEETSAQVTKKRRTQI
jgi:hypothetical protein